MHFGVVDNRYKFLVLHVPFRAGKSRLARPLFCAGQTWWPTRRTLASRVCIRGLRCWARWK
eukprot:2840299-Pyramimonas_sp.AAC.1